MINDTPVENLMTDQQRLTEPDDGRPASEHKLSMITQALDSLMTVEGMLGRFAVINLATGEYVTGRTLMEATDSFQGRFRNIMGFAHRVGEPLYEPLLL
jgi:hypothetical protein